MVASVLRCRIVSLLLFVFAVAAAQASLVLHSRRAAARPALAPERARPHDFADPFVFREGGSYFAFATGANGSHIQAATSSDLATWRVLPDALPTLPRWAARTRGLTWAPSVLKRPGGYVLYYTVRDRRSGFQCISRAVSARPEGPYTDVSTTPFICQASGADSFCGSIDPSPFVDSDGSAYLYWKSDENSLACRGAPRLWVQRLSDSGTELEGPPTTLLAMDRSWEVPIVEGPAMLRHDGTYYLFYSANWYESAAYAIGYATCSSAMGPCRKVTTDAPWLESDGVVLGPGGQDFFTDADGRTLMAYHAWTGPRTTYAKGGARSLRVTPLAFVDGVPTLEEPLTPLSLTRTSLLSVAR